MSLLSEDLLLDRAHSITILFGRIYWQCSFAIAGSLTQQQHQLPDEMNNNEPLVLLNVVLIVAIIMRVRVDVQVVN